MKYKATLARRVPRPTQSARGGIRRAARRSGGVALGLMLLCQSLVLVTVSPATTRAQVRQQRGSVAPKPTPAPAPQVQQGPAAPIYEVSEPRPAQPLSTAVVNFEALSQKAAAARLANVSAPETSGGSVSVEQNFRMSVEEGVAPAGAAPAALASDLPTGPLAPSPAPASSFQAQNDIPKFDGPQAGFSFIPPDTDGAVGLDKLIVTINNVYTIQNKLTGVPLSTVSTDTFWNAGSATPRGTGYFDPKTVYDPYNNRFIATILSNGVSVNSRLHIAVSQTSDPQGNWFIATFTAGTAATNRGADFPSLGFNKNWITVSLNIFNLTTGGFVQSDVYFIDYPPARTGTFGGSIFSLGGAPTVQPSVTYSTTEENMYAPLTLSTTSLALLYWAPDGADANVVPDLTIVSTAIPINADSSAINFNLGEIMPQAPPPPGFTGTPRKILGNDARLGNAVFRNGSIWTAHHFGVRGTATVSLRTAAQAYQLSPAAAVLQRLRIEDPTASDTNGGNWYGFASIGVNRANDVVVGYTQFASDQYPSAGYSAHLNTDAANTIRDPVVYQAGLGYYDKDFTASGTDTGGNRWGDYSFTTIDPVNDTDVWTIQEISNPPVGTGNPAGSGNNSGRWNTWWAKVEFAGIDELNISEFRLRGPNGSADEFIEIYNFGPASVTVTPLDGSAGYSVAASDGVPRCVIPTGTVIPSRGHVLCTNSAGYSLGLYPAGTATTAAGDFTYAVDIADNAGIALFRTANPANYSEASRLDAAGSTSEANALYREGAGYPAIAALNIDYAFFRDLCGKGGSTTQPGGCPAGGLPKDTNDNGVDFVYVDTSGVNNGPGAQRLGAPGPENLSSPVQRNSSFSSPLLDSTVSASAPPNRVRDFTSDPANNSTFGTLEIRRRYTNNTGAPVTRLRFRIVDFTTFPVPAGFADMRARTSTPTVATGVNDAGTCSPSPAPCTVTVQGTTLETPPAQPNGGGFNSSLSADTVTLATPLLPGETINLRFLLGLQQTGNFKFLVNIEALP
jgi:hypothetical protein